MAQQTPQNHSGTDTQPPLLSSVVLGYQEGLPQSAEFTQLCLDARRAKAGYEAMIRDYRRALLELLEAAVADGDLSKTDAAHIGRAVRQEEFEAARYRFHDLTEAE